MYAYLHAYIYIWYICYVYGTLNWLVPSCMRSSSSRSTNHSAGCKFSSGWGNAQLFCIWSALSLWRKDGALEMDAVNLAYTRYCFTSRLLCTNQSSLHCPSHLHRPHGCDIIAILLRNSRPPSDPPCSRRTSYNYCIAISCKGQGLTRFHKTLDPNIGGGNAQLFCSGFQVLAAVQGRCVIEELDTGCMSDTQMQF